MIYLIENNYQGTKRQLKEETIKNLQEIYHRIDGSSIQTKLGANVAPYKEAIYFFNSMQQWKQDDLAFAYRVIASQSRRAGEYAMFVDDLQLVLNFFSSNDDDFEKLQFRLEEQLLLQI